MSSDQNGQAPPHRNLKGDELRGLLPTDTCRVEGAVNVKNYVTILEDLLLRLQINVAVAKGFKDLEFPQPHGGPKKYIDLWPIQMSVEITADGGEKKQNVLTTNFDTYTLILQLGCILNTVPAWKKAYTLRVIVFVEYETDVEEERGRVKTLLDNLRIRAEILVFWLAAGELKTYQVIVNGDVNAAGQDAERTVDETLKNEEWWSDVRKLRGRHGTISASEELADAQGLLDVTLNWPSSSFQQGRGNPATPAKRFEGLRRLIRKSSRRRSSGDLNALGVRLGMQTSRLHDDVLHRHASHASASEDSASDDTDSEVFESASARASQASENNNDELEEDLDGNATQDHSPLTTVRRRSHGDSLRGPPRPMSPQSNIKRRGQPSLKVTSDLTDDSDTDSSSKAPVPLRPRPARQSSAAKFSSRPQPKTTVNPHDGPGPSIMFTDAPSTPPKTSPSIYTHHQLSAATGFPSHQSTPLSFNDLPCRAQHLILNELMQQHSNDTAVLFTTLPSPVEGTCENEEDCVSYLSDLDVLWKDLPPVLLIHSNSMTVTMNL